MKTKRAKSNVIGDSKTVTIRTSLMEILQALTSQTEDDGLVVESLGNIFASYHVRFGQALAPVRLENASQTARSLGRSNFGRHRAAWA